MLTWPHAATDWAAILEQAEQTYIEIGCQISLREKLLLVCQDQQHGKSVLDRLIENGADEDNLITAVAESDDTWARDHGPLSVISDGNLLIRDFQFNGWGDKYPAEQDNRITRTLNQAAVFGQTEVETVEFVLEGGAVETDGEGTFLGTRSSVLTETRNPGLSQSEVEALLTSKLGFDRFLWLDHGHLSGDDTDGHIDTLARFSDPETILYVTAYPDDPDYPSLKAMEQELMAFRTRSDQPYELVALPPITPQFSGDGRRLPASYANFLIINNAVLLPVYQDDNDQQAVSCLKGCFPDHDIIPIDCCTLIRQNGSLHCITMQFPAGIDFQS